MSGVLLAAVLLVASLGVASGPAETAVGSGGGSSRVPALRVEGPPPAMVGDAPHHPSSSIDRPPPIKGNPAFDPNLPTRVGRPGRLLFRCARAEDGATVELFSSAVDFDDGRQSFFLKRRDHSGKETLYPVHGFFLDGGASGVFMIHDGKGLKEGDAYRIDQSVNMGVLFLRKITNAGGSSAVQAIIDVFAEEGEGETGKAAQSLAEYSCRWEKARRLDSLDKHVRLQPNSGATPPSHWYRESDRTLLTCRAGPPDGEYRIELRVAKVWPGHLGFLVVRTPGQDQPVGYNVHMLEGPGRLLIHAHSYPHRTKTIINTGEGPPPAKPGTRLASPPEATTLDTMEETETVIGGLLLVPAKTGYRGWIGLAGANADPYNITFSRDATVADYAAQGRNVVPPLPVTCTGTSS